MRQKKILGFPQNVVALSLVSFLNDIGGETIKRALPLYLANALGVKTTAIGLLEGVAESTPHLLQPLSGYLSDKFHKRKPLIVAGQVLRSSMLLLVTATSWPQALLLRFLDRSGKGITGAPRDALISASDDGKSIGAAFGLNRALDNAGAVIGLFLAGAMIGAVGGTTGFMTRELFIRIVLLAGIPLCIAVGILVFGIRDAVDRIRYRFRLHNAFGHKFYIFLAVSFIFTLGNSSDAFLLLRAQQGGMSLSSLFYLLAAYTFVPAVAGFPLSKLSDSIGRKKLLLSGWVLYSIVYLLFAINGHKQAIPWLFLLYGLYYAFTEGAAKAMVSDLVKPDHRGTAFGLYNMVVGATLLPASLVAGLLWDTISPSAPFFFGSFMAVAGTAGLLLFL